MSNSDLVLTVHIGVALLTNKPFIQSFKYSIFFKRENIRGTFTHIIKEVLIVLKAPSKLNTFKVGNICLNTNKFKIHFFHSWKINWYENWPNTVSYLKTLKMVPTAAMSDVPSPQTGGTHITRHK